MTTVPALATSDLVRFLLARVDEDDDELRTLRRRLLRSAAKDAGLTGVRAIDRQQAECQAKRTVIGHAQHLLLLRDLPAEKAVRDAAAGMLRALAGPYRDHYAFRPEWRDQAG